MQDLAICHSEKKLSNIISSMSIYEAALAILVFTDGLSRLKVWNSESPLNTFINAIQLGIYMILLVLIVKNRYSIEVLIVIGMSLALLLIGYSTTGEAVFIRDLLLIVAAKDVQFNKILRSIRYSMSFVVAIAILSVAFGFSDMTVQRRGGVALGFSHPNQASLILTVILLLWLAERRNKFSASDFVLAIFVTGTIYFFTKSRTPLALAVLVILTGVMYKSRPKIKIGLVLKKTIVLLPFLCLLFTVLTAYFLPSVGLVNQLDLFLSNRIFLNWYAFEHHGMRLFGQIVNLTEGSGTVYNQIRGIWNSAITVDNSYTLALVSLGIVPTLVFTAWTCFAEKKIVEKGDLFLLVLGAVFCIYGITESQMIDVFNNFMLLFTFSSSGSLLTSDSAQCLDNKDCFLEGISKNV